MDLLKRFEDFVCEQKLFGRKDRLLLAVSGGVDSTALCELCSQSSYNFDIAHCNFQLRGEESKRDENFVRMLAARYGVRVIVKTFDTEKYAAQNKLGVQEAARNLRYEWFRELIRGNGTDKFFFSYLVTAHHADDNVETVLMNFCRGTGIDGLVGMPFISGHIRRPLINFWKDELMDFARENHLEFVEDSSNLSSKYTRNLFRNEIIPLIASAYPRVKWTLKDNIERFREIQKLYHLSVGALKQKLCKTKNGEIHIPIKQLISYNNRALIFEIISDYHFTERQIDEVIKLADAESGKFIQSPAGSHRIIKFRSWFIVTPKSTQAETLIVEEGTKNIQCPGFNLKFSVIEGTPPAISHSPLVASLDAKEISFPLVLRRWRPGDYFYPLGMKKKKKLARFFIDEKLPKTEKEKIWVIEMNKKIIWVVGLRIDDRFKVTDKTRSMLKITLETP